MDKPTSFKDDVARLLDEIGIGKRVSPNELEAELARRAELASSPLVLGIIARLVERNAGERLREVVPLFLQWRNFIPRAELGGLSPAEYETRFPRGEHEAWIIHRLFQNYELSLRERQLIGSLEKDDFDLKKDFELFEQHFLALIPARQPFPDRSIALAHREIIHEERARAGWPESRREAIGIALSTESMVMNFSDGIERIRRSYLATLSDIEALAAKPEKRSGGRMKKILHSLREAEPFMKCTAGAAQFYTHFATVALLYGAEGVAAELARRALAINPRHRETRELLAHIRKTYSLKTEFKRTVRAIRRQRSDTNDVTP
ncbi:MAG: hypothetical protein U1A28_03215 [Patescibacteria group bacterium]|nr:hypothetical protein [Patescibacteria group bacterium]